MDEYMFDEDRFEKYDLLSGNTDLLKQRVYALGGVLLECGKSAKSAGESIMNRFAESDDPEKLKKAITLLQDLVLANTKDEDDGVFSDNFWTDVYRLLFEESPFLMESFYIPKDGEMAAITRACIKNGMRIKTEDVPEGTIV